MSIATRGDRPPLMLDIPIGSASLAGFDSILAPGALENLHRAERLAVG